MIDSRTAPRLRTGINPGKRIVENVDLTNQLSRRAAPARIAGISSMLDLTYRVPERGLRYRVYHCRGCSAIVEGGRFHAGYRGEHYWTMSRSTSARDGCFLAVREWSPFVPWMSSALRC